MAEIAFVAVVECVRDRFHGAVYQTFYAGSTGVARISNGVKHPTRRSRETRWPIIDHGRRFRLSDAQPLCNGH